MSDMIVVERYMIKSAELEEGIFGLPLFAQKMTLYGNFKKALWYKGNIPPQWPTEDIHNPNCDVNQFSTHSLQNKILHDIPFTCTNPG